MVLGRRKDSAIHRLKKERKDQVGRPRHHPDPLCASKTPANPQQIHQLYPHGGRSRPGPSVSTAAATTTSCMVSDRPQGSFCFVSCQPALRPPHDGHGLLPRMPRVRTQSPSTVSRAFSTKWHPPLASSGPPHPPRDPQPPATGASSSLAGPRHALFPLRRNSPPTSQLAPSCQPARTRLLPAL